VKRKEPPWPGEVFLEGFDLSAFEFDVTDSRTHPTLAVRWAGRELLAEDRVADTKGYPYALVGYAIQGEQILHCDGMQLKIEPGMVFWVQKFHDAVRVTVPGTKPVYYLVMLLGNDVEELFDKHLEVPVGVATITHPHLVESIMTDIMEEGRYDSKNKEHNCVLLAEVLVSRIGADMVLTAEQGQTARATYRRCRQYMTAHFATIRTLAQVAENCGVSVPYLCRLFENFADTSPYELLTQLRLKKAAMMLATTRMPVASVALAVGYRNIPQFSRMFKATFGVPPSRYSAGGAPMTGE
jgi:AraC-like DNA-binding protein